MSGPTEVAASPGARVAAGPAAVWRFLTDPANRLWRDGVLAAAFVAGMVYDVGYLVKQNQEREQVQVLLEGRSQIARDLHDVVAHHVNLIVIQAETGPDLVQRDEHDWLPTSEEKA